MKHPCYPIISALCVFWLSLSGCIHTYPDGDGVDPTLLQLGVEVIIDLDWQPENVTLTKTGDFYDCSHRLIIEFNRNGKLHGRCEHLLTAEEYVKGDIKLIMPFDFNAVSYSVTAWMDCVDSSSSTDNISGFYDISSLSEIKRKDNHIRWDAEAECAFAFTEINLREYKDQWNAKVVVPLTLSSPVGRFEFVATDLDAFCNHISENIGRGETYSICLAFEGRIATSFNLCDNEASTYLTSPEYYFPFSYQSLYQSDGMILSGSAFVDDSPQTVKAKVLVYNSARMIVSKSPVIQFPIERGKVSVITGEMLADYYTGSFNINNIWDGEIIIEL